MTVYFASDHAGFSLRQTLLAHVQAAGHDVVDLGPAEASSVDYPDFGVKLATALQQDDAGYGIAICGSGIGISIALNRFAWVRAALANQPLAAANGWLASAARTQANRFSAIEMPMPLPHMAMP